MAWTIYKSTDASAPSLTGEIGKLTALLDACLVNGYPGKSAAGWVKAEPGTNKAVYRPGLSARARQYYRVDDASPDSDARFARLVGYDTMSAVDTGTGPFGVSGGAPLYCYPRKSNTADSTARPWIIAADDRTAILLINNGFSSDRYAVTYLGEFFSYVGTDSYQGILIGRSSLSVGGCYEAGGLWQSNSASTYNLHPYAWLARDFDHTPDGTQAGLSAHGLAFYNVAGDGISHPMRGYFTGTNPADSALWVSPVPVISKRSDPCIRGHLRGFYVPLVTLDYYSPGDTFSGTGDLAGKTFEYLHIQASASSTDQSGNIALETSTPASS
jgi:hypothetical protein